MPAKVAVIKTCPQTVIEDIDGLVETAGLEDALPLDKTTILKDNISWHMPFLSANTTPWQLEGVIKAGLIGGSCLCLYTCGTILLFCILLKSFFFTIFFHIAIPLTYLLAFISALLYKKTGNIITGTIVTTVILVMLLCTLAPYANYAMFLH